MNAYNELLTAAGYQDITSRQTSDRTDKVKDYQLHEFIIIFDRINLRLLQNGTGLLDMPLTDISLCLAIAFTLLPENVKQKYLLNNVKGYIKYPPDNKNDTLNIALMQQIFDLAAIRQKQTKQTKTDKTDRS
jgi:hypothetical protein